jgi:hypothetical protein
MRCATACGAQCAVCGVQRFNSCSVAVCSSAQGSVLQCFRQCAAVRQCVCWQCAAVLQCGSVRQYSSVQQCGSVNIFK